MTYYKNTAITLKFKNFHALVSKEPWQNIDSYALFTPGFKTWPRWISRRLPLNNSTNRNDKVHSSIDQNKA